MAIDVEGLTVDQIMKMDLNKLSESDLRKVSTRLMSAANKRIKRLKQASGGKMSPAMQQMNIRTPSGKFSVKGKSLNQLRHEAASMKDFLKGKTSSVRGWNKIRRERREELEEAMGQPLTDKQEKKFWDVYHKLEETKGGQLGTVYDSDKIMEAIFNRVKKRWGIGHILRDLDDHMEDYYKEGINRARQDIETVDIEASDFFDS